MPLIRSNEQGISSTKSDERGMQLQQKQRTASARFYTPIQPDQALKSPIFGRLHVSRFIMCACILDSFRNATARLAGRGWWGYTIAWEGRSRLNVCTVSRPQHPQSTNLVSRPLAALSSVLPLQRQRQLVGRGLGW